MSYRWQDCYCRECECMNMEEVCSYDSSKRYCTERSKYYNPNDKACSKMKYDETRKKVKGGCYLTTIINNILGQPDNGYALTTLREFRDEYMLNQPELYPMLIEYDIIGPHIAEALKNDSISTCIAKMHYENNIIPIINHIEHAQYELAILKYQKMTNQLRNYYQIDDTIKTKINFNIKTLGKARA